MSTVPAPGTTSLVPQPPEPTTLAGKARSIGGLLALVAGLITIVCILVVAAAAGVTTSQFTQLATAAIGVVGSGVGAYFGVKVGSDQTANAVQGQREEAARAQVFAAHVTPGPEADAALANAFPHAIVPRTGGVSAQTRAPIPPRS